MILSKNIKKSDKILPRHLAIMIDGNRRWAKERHLSSSAGHRAGIERVVDIIRYAKAKGIKVLTLYGFSTENWKRSKREVSSLMNLFTQFAKEYAPEFHREGIKFQHLGRKDRLPKTLIKAIEKAENITKNNQQMILNIALDYGGVDEIVRAIRQMIRKKIPAQKVTEDTLMSFLDTKGLPSVDFVIRTSGVLRLSNFLPLQSTYAELYFPKIYWPDFDRHQFDLALAEFRKRQRRFGK